jgi:hypothetical protein
VKIPITKDSWLYQFKKDMAYGDGRGWKENGVEGKAAMFVGFGGTDKKIPVLGFDVAQLKGKTVKKATLKLCIVFAGSAKEEVHEAKAILQNWEESKATYKTVTKFGPAVSKVSMSGSWNYKDAPKWFSWDVTSIVKDCIAGKAFGIAIDTVGDSGVDRQIESRESENADLRPYLEIE